MTSPRFGQMTFTSFDSDDRSPGGYQVMHAEGLDDAEVDFLKGSIDPLFAWPVDIPEIPTDAQREMLPSRLVYARGPGGKGAAYWHMVPAGKDAGGRPGNVFAHVVLDRSPDDGGDALRPVDVARCVHWLRPFGRDEVRAAALPRLSPMAGAATDLFGEVHFLNGLINNRGGSLLAVLLDALHAALDGGAPVVLAVEEPGAALTWIAALGRVMSPGTARRLFWSTLERATTLTKAVQSGVHLAFVPRDDLSRPLGEVVVLDELAQPGLGSLGGDAHRAANSAKVDVTPWSGMTAGVLDQPELAREILAMQDAVAVDIGDRDLDPGWPMAVAVTSLSEPLSDADDEAIALAESAMPQGRSPAALQRVLARQLTRRLGVNAATAFAGLQQLTERDPPMLRELAVRIYLERVLSDESWLLQPGGVPLPAVTDSRYVPDAELLRRAHEVLSAQADIAREPGEEPTRLAALAVRLVDFVLRAGMLDVAVDSHGLDQVAHRLVQLALEPVVLDPVRGPAFVTAVSPVDSPVRTQLVALVVRDLVPHSSWPPGLRVPAPVLFWLFPQPPLPPPAESLADPAYGLDPLIGEIAAQATAVVADPSAFRMAAIWAALSSPPVSMPRLVHLAAGPPLPAKDLLVAASTFGPRAVLGFLLPTLASSHEDAFLTRLARDCVLAPQHGLAGEAGYDLLVNRVMTAAHLRSVAVGWWESRGEERRTALALSILEDAERLLSFEPNMLLAAGLEDTLVAAHVVDVVCRPVPVSARDQLDRRVAGIAASGGLVPEIKNILWHVLENRAITDREAVVAALHGGPEPLPGPRGAARWQALRTLTVPGEDGRPEPVLKAVIRLRVRNKRFAVAEMRESVQEHIHRDIQDAVTDRHEARRWIGDHDAFAERWWASVAAGAGTRRP